MDIKSKDIIIFAILFSLIAYVNNLIPWATLPTLGQVLWTLGFAKSITHNVPFDFYAHDFGYPAAAPISFGLSAVIPISILLRFGLDGNIAYTLVFLFFFVLSYFSVYKFSRGFGNSKLVSQLAATLWLCLPVVTNHADYSMLSLGIALIPFYLLTSFAFIKNKDFYFSKEFIIKSVLFYITVLISVFMDGYTFVILAISACLFFIIYFYNECKNYKRVIVIGIMMLLGFGFAYLAYTGFINKSEYSKDPIEVFRGWGIDVTYLIIPSYSISWISDFLNLSAIRTTEEQFGDASVWNTTFSLPLIAMGLWGIFKANKSKFKNILLCLFLFSFYMSLGPSLKIESVKPEGYNEENSTINTMIMPEEYSVIPTGNELLYKHVPGVNSMRATYRWSVLMLFSLMILFLMSCSKYNQKYISIVILISIFVYMPNLGANLREGVKYNVSYKEINETLIEKFKEDIPKNTIVAFLPWGNDFFVNYISPYSGFKAYNIGGDKNLDIAKAEWPESLLAFHNSLNGRGIEDIKHIFFSSDADYLIIPYFDLLWSAHVWPCQSNAEMVSHKNNDFVLACLKARRESYKNILSDLKNSQDFIIRENQFYAVVQIKNKFLNYPVTASLKNFGDGDIRRVLGNGWYPLEDEHVWSLPKATLILSPKREGGAGFVKIHFNVYGAAKDKNKAVNFTLTQGDYMKRVKILSEGITQDVDIPLPHIDIKSHVNIEVEDPKSPSETINGSTDNNLLGISLISVDIK